MYSQLEFLDILMALHDMFTDVCMDSANIGRETDYFTGEDGDWVYDA